MAEPLVLYAESTWVSPWAFHAMVALEEKQLAYRLELPPLPLPAETRALLRARTVLGKVPVLVHGDTWIGESLAISEYLAETFPSPHHPRIFPADLGQRARARGVMSMLRTTLFALREDRPTTTLFGARTATHRKTPPLSLKGSQDADELVRIATALLGDRATLCDAWCIADADLALALARLVHNGDPVPPALARYVDATWARPSVQTYVAHARAGT